MSDNTRRLALVVGVLTLLALLAPAAPAAAAPDRLPNQCVTRAEYRAVKHGATPRRVARVFGDYGFRYPGRASMAATYGHGLRAVSRDYRTCTRGGVVTLDYANWNKRGKRVRMHLVQKWVAW